MKEKIKLILKKIPGISWLRNTILFQQEYHYDSKFFKRHYTYAKETKNTLSYQILLLSHGIEKGLSNRKLRCFGLSKVKNMIRFLELYVKNGNYADDFCFLVGINSLRAYQKCYEENCWMSREEYKLVSDFLKKYEEIFYLEVGSKILKSQELQKNSQIDYAAFLSGRHSVRNFQNMELKDSDIEKAVFMALKTPTACNRQMVKIYYVQNDEKKRYIFKIGQGFGGFDYESSNLFVITFDVNANYFIGERNQGWLNAGLVSMNFVNGLHSLGIGSCFVQFGNKNKEEKKLKTLLGLPKSERIAILLAAGYYAEESKIPCSPRKNVHDIYQKIN